MKNRANAIALLAVLLCLVNPLMRVSAEEVSFNVSMSKEVYASGENLVLNYEVSNPTDKKVTYKCMVTYDPPTSKTPGCVLKEVVLEPGQRLTGSILSPAEFPVETGAQVKLIDENENVVSIQTIPIIRVREPIKAECGNSVCDAGETYGTCPDDCLSGSSDGYCDGTADGTCDPDCGRTEDADCACNGDKKCEGGFESYKNCPADCPSGSSDGYCNGTADGTCDPDCTEEQDADCGKADFMSYLPYAVLAFVLFAVLGYVGYKKAEARKIEEQREEFLKWKQEKGAQ